MKKYDLHIHSHYSPCGMIRPEVILKRAKRAGLDGIAITDHHTMKAYPILKRLNTDKNFEIIPGMEITTQYGDVLALYIKKEIKSRDFFEVIKDVKRQKGIIIIPHPFTISRTFSFRYPFDKLKKIVIAKKLDIAVEVFNSKNFNRFNNKSKNVAETYGFPQVGASDAHLSIDIGQGYTLFEGDLKNALKRSKTAVGGRTTYKLISNFIAVISPHIFYPIRKLWVK
jgi:predicted metal-dependent phosphoesterase TrpH